MANSKTDAVTAKPSAEEATTTEEVSNKGKMGSYVPTAEEVDRIRALVLNGIPDVDDETIRKISTGMCRQLDEGVPASKIVEDIGAAGLSSRQGAAWAIASIITICDWNSNPETMNYLNSQI
ncbi:DUF732 domain-containing protein [Tomitella biformata]|uniref:DUF732 domain-containing protein n=1 Tax=Tomitella biformata TaxID=630403 RepID=UPI0011DD6843|nr:hypothetical protein [Tomitella biformata]